MLTRDELLAAPLSELRWFVLKIFHGEHRGGADHVVIPIHTITRGREAMQLKDVLRRLKGAATKQLPRRVVVIDNVREEGARKDVRVFP